MLDKTPSQRCTWYPSNENKLYDAEHGKNGFIFETSQSLDYICDLIEQAFKLETNVSQTVQHLTWNAFAQDVVQICSSLTTWA